MKTKGMLRAKIEPLTKVWLSREEALVFMGCSDDYLRKVRDSGEVQFAKDGKMLWYNVHSLTRYIERRRVI